MTQIYPIFLNARTHAHKNIATLIRGKLTFLGIVVMTNKLLLSHVQIHITWTGVESSTYYVQMHHFIHRDTRIDIFLIHSDFLFVFDSFSYIFRILSNSTYIEILFYFWINVKTIWHFTQLHFNAISHIQFWTNSFS